MTTGLINKIVKCREIQELYKYEHIVVGFQEAIAANEFQIGDKLPSIDKMAKILGYSRMTIDKAYKTLSATGFISPVRLKGYYITSLAPYNS